MAALLAVAALLAAGCSGDDGGAAEEETTSTSSSGEVPTSDATTTTAAPSGPAALRGDGLGLAAFGAAPDEALSALQSLLGNPTEDTGWQPSASSSFGTCPGREIRAVRWDGLTLLFTNGSTEHGTGRHFFQWRQLAAPPPIATVKGLSVGATRADAEQLYPGTTVSEDELVAGAVAEIPAEGGTLIGFLDDGDVITNLEAGVPCGE